MACILHIETSTDVCSVAVSQDGACIFHEEDHSGPNHAVKSSTFIDEALSFIDSHLIPLDAVAISSGPGSYTGLRIGVSTAKGICYGRDVKLISVPTLQLLCVPVLLREKVQEEDALLCPMIDARRMEVYAQVFDRALHEKRAIQADIVDSDTYKEFLDECDRCIVTFIDKAYEADAYFPNLDKLPEWELTEESDEQVYFDLTYTYRIYTRR
jgi:tRNA threonylcarbamoyladenosine biosynthesis protein TsaB